MSEAKKHRVTFEEASRMFSDLMNVTSSAIVGFAASIQAEAAAREEAEAEARTLAAELRKVETKCNRCHRPMKGTAAYDGACACGGIIVEVAE